MKFKYHDYPADDVEKEMDSPLWQLRVDPHFGDIISSFLDRVYDTQGSFGNIIVEFRAALLERALILKNGNKTEAAKFLNLGRTTLVEMLSRKSFLNYPVRNWSTRSVGEDA